MGLMKKIKDFFGHRRQAQQISESRERLADDTSHRLKRAVDENKIVSANLAKLVREMQGLGREEGNQRHVHR